MAEKTVVPPKRRQCGTMAVHNRLLESSPSYRQNLMRLEAATTRRMAMGMVGSKKLVTIKVVVHVVYKSTAQKISASQIKSQITALNRDYSAGNADKSKLPSVWKSLATDTSIRFALATKDPRGKATTGIIYQKTTVSSFTDDDSVKSAASGGANPWPTAKYLNLWVCQLGGGLLGYAQFPGGPAPTTDGVVILNTAFGTVGTATAPFNLGRTATHEVGHWLNLRHIWGDTEHCEGSDYVADTPKAQLPNYGKPAFPHVTCSNGPNGDLFYNYMDYVDDDTMVMFTSGQVTRMHATLAGPRASLV